MAKKEVSAKKSVAFELVAYIVAGLLALWGLVYIVLGLVATYINVIPSKNYLQQASDSIQKAFGLGFFYWGLILLALGALIAIVVLCVFAKKTDRLVEREARRAARRNRLEQELSSKPVEPEVKDAVVEEIKPVEEAPVVSENEASEEASAVEENPVSEETPAEETNAE